MPSAATSAVKGTVALPFVTANFVSFVKLPNTVISLTPVSSAAKSDVTTTSISFSTVGAGYLALWYADATNVNLPAFVKVTLYFVP